MYSKDSICTKVNWALELPTNRSQLRKPFFIWGGWRSGIIHNTQNRKVLSLNPTDGIGQDGLWDPTQYKAPGNLPVGYVQCAPLTTSYHLYFPCVSKILSSRITGQYGTFTVKNATLHFNIYVPDIFSFFNCFSLKKNVCISLSPCHIYMPGCCLRGQNMLKQVCLRGRKIKGHKKASPLIFEAFC